MAITVLNIVRNLIDDPTILGRFPAATNLEPFVDMAVDQINEEIVRSSFGSENFIGYKSTNVYLHDDIPYTSLPSDFRSFLRLTQRSSTTYPDKDNILDELFPTSPYSGERGCWITGPTTPLLYVYPTPINDDGTTGEIWVLEYIQKAAFTQPTDDGNDTLDKKVLALCVACDLSASMEGPIHERMLRRYNAALSDLIGRIRDTQGRNHPAPAPPMAEGFDSFDPWEG